MEEKQFKFIDTTSTQKIFSLKKRIRVVAGGTSASKTISILVWHIDYAQTHKNKKMDILSESYPHLQDGAIKDFKSIMVDRGYWKDDRWNNSQHSYLFETGTVLKVISIDKLGKAHGPRRDTLFLNEANNIAFDIYDQLEVRTNDVIWLDYNPSNEFWYYTEIKNKLDHDFITLTYLDCLNALPQSIINSIESKKHRKGWWKVYGFGELGEVEGKIYKDWAIIDEIPHEARLARYGLDFGYTNDPTAIVAIYYYNGGYILDEVAYTKGLSNKQIADLLLNVKKALVIADSAEPKSIDDIKGYGISILPTVKGKDSVRYGINVVQEQQISVTKQSINLIKEFRNYLWKVDREGNILQEPEGGLDHHMDAIRYGMTSLIPIIKRREYLKNMPIVWHEENNINPAR